MPKIETIQDHLIERDIRERRRARRITHTRLRDRIHALAAWWSDFGRALVPFALGAVAALPLCALGVMWAIGGGR